MRKLSDRFIAAVRLCTGSAPVKQRLTEAWLTQLDELKPEELPVMLRHEFNALRAAMYAHQPQPDESAPTASIRKMSPSQATRYTALIVKMLGEILRMKYAAETQNLSQAGSLAFETDRSELEQTLN